LYDELSHFHIGDSKDLSTKERSSGERSVGYSTEHSSSKEQIKEFSKEPKERSAKEHSSPFSSSSSFSSFSSQFNGLLNYNNKIKIKTNLNKDNVHNAYGKNQGNDTFIYDKKESLEILLENMVLMGCNSTMIGIIYVYI
jgi:hypothetical protein